MGSPLIYKDNWIRKALWDWLETTLLVRTLVGRLGIDPRPIVEGTVTRGEMWVRTPPKVLIPYYWSPLPKKEGSKNRDVQAGELVSVLYVHHAGSAP